MRSIILSAATAAICAAMAVPSQAAVVVFTEEVGGDVQFTYSGTLDLSGTSTPYGSSVNNVAIVIPSEPYFLNGADGAMEFRDLPFSNVSGSVGAGSQTNTSTYSGDVFFFRMSSNTSNVIGTALGYGGEFISGTTTFSGTTIAGLGLTQGASLVGTLISGDTVTWNISADPNAVSTVPLPATMPLLFAALGGMGVAARRRKAG